MKRTFGALLAVGALLGAAIAPASAQAAPEKSDNVKHVAQFKYTGGTELAASGRYLYSGEMNGSTDRNQDPEKGGLHIYDTVKMKEVGFLHCPGNDNDVEVVKPGLVVMSFAMNQCALVAGSGIMLVDVKNPAKPRVISAFNTGKSHTVRPVPGESILYMAGGGYPGGPNSGPKIIDVSNPYKPEVVAEPQTLTMDCHDISFSITEEDRQLGFCAGALGTGEVKIWDVSDPIAPALIGEIVNPLIQYSHFAIANHDGTLLAIDDEAAFVAHDCNTGQSPYGRVWIYDISNPQTPIVHSSFAAPAGRGGDGTTNIGTLVGWVPSWCLAHGLDWHPTTNNVAVTWFTAGTSVLKIGDPVTPQEVAYFDAEDGLPYSTLWHNGYLFTNDMGRGVDAFKIKGLK